MGRPGEGSLVAVLMGSKSDWDTMKACSETLAKFGVPHESHVMSAHRSPKLAADFAGNAESRGIEVIIGAAGGAELLPMLGKSMTPGFINGAVTMKITSSTSITSM